MRRLPLFLVALLACTGLAIAGCGQAAPASPTAPVAPTKAAAPAPTAPPPTAAAPKAPAPTAAATKAPAPTAPAPTAPAPTAAAPKAPAPTAAPAAKVDFPQKGKSITMILPYAAGGTSDSASRMLAPLLEKDLGVSIQPVNKVGAGGQIAATELVGSKPDGYTIGLTAIPSMTVSYLDPERGATFARKDFAPIANYIAEPGVLYARTDTPYKSVKDLVDAAKAKPQTIKLGTAGLMGQSHLAMVLLEQLSGAKFAFVHFDGNAPAMAALLGGHVDLIHGGAGVGLPHVKSGALKAVAIMDTAESPLFPGVKSVAAQGYNVNLPTTYGYSAPAGTPKGIVDVLSAAIKKATENEELKTKLAAQAQVVRYMNPDQFATYWAEGEAMVKPLLPLAKEK